MAFSSAHSSRLQKASQALTEALDNYVTICSELDYRHQYCNAGDYAYQKLLDDLTAQLQLNETKLKETRAIISRSQRYHLPLPKVDFLPDELLIKIFGFVLDTHPARSESYRDEYPDTEKYHPLVEPSLDYIAITHVCSVWRRVALGSRNLWTDIDISPFSPFLPQFLARAQTYASLSNDLPLHLRLLDDCDISSSSRSDLQSDFIRFITSIAPRLRSLELGIYWDFDPIHLTILGDCLEHSKPGKLARLDIITNRLRPSPDSCCPIGMSRMHSFFRSNPRLPHLENPDDPGMTFTSVSFKRFESLLGRVTVLRLNRLYPVWSSAAYHGLVELYLGSRNEAEGPGAIPESSLAMIFRSSPGLRVLHFGLNVVPEKACLPVDLNDLESLLLESPCADTHRSLLRTISPGTKLFRVNIKLRISNRETIQKSSLLKPILGQLRRCVAHSKVTEFFLDTSLRIRHHQVTLRDILKIIPHVRVLGLRGGSFDTDGVDLCKSLHTLHLRNNLVIFDSFKEFVWAHQLKRITVSYPVVSNGEYDENDEFVEFPAQSLWDIRRTIEVISLHRRDLGRRILVDGWDY